MSKNSKNKKQYRYKKIATKFFLFAAIFSVYGLVFIFQESIVFAQETTDISLEEQKKLEKKQKDLKDKIAKEAEKLEESKNKLNQIRGLLNVTQNVINQTAGHIEDTEQVITRKESEIKRYEEKIIFQKAVLASFLRKIYYNEEKQELNLTYSNKDMLDLVSMTDYTLDLKSKVMEIISGIKADRERILREKEELEGVKKEKEELLAIKEVQKKELASQNLSVNQEVVKKEATIGELNAKLAAVQNSLSSLLGKSYNAKDIQSAAAFASKQTGVRKDFIMGMLVVETDLGRYTGGCTYSESKMSGTRADIFKQIAKELDKDYKKLKVSCPPKSYAGTGGAMGVAQFMPDTWRGYQARVAEKTGHKPPDPWNLTDGVMAMAIKLSVVPGVTSHQKSGEKNAAKLYLSGTTASKYDWYADRVLYWADNYEKKL